MIGIIMKKFFFRVVNGVGVGERAAPHTHTHACADAH